MKTLTELAHIARKAKGEHVHDSMVPYWKDALSGVSADDILAIESEVTALRERLAASEADAERYRELKRSVERVQHVDWEWEAIDEYEDAEQITLDERLDAARNPTKE